MTTGSQERKLYTLLEGYKLVQGYKLVASTVGMSTEALQNVNTMWSSAIILGVLLSLSQIPSYPHLSLCDSPWPSHATSPRQLVWRGMKNVSTVIDSIWDTSFLKGHVLRAWPVLLLRDGVTVRKWGIVRIRSLWAYSWRVCWDWALPLLSSSVRSVTLPLTLHHDVQPYPRLNQRD